MMQKRKIKYLYQLIITSCILIVVPTLFYFLFVWTKTYNEMNRRSEEYYSEKVGMFSDSFVEELLQLKSYATMFALKSQSIGNGLDVIHEGSQKMIDSPYYQSQACKELNDYSQKAVVDFWGVYYCGKEFVLDKNYKYTINDFIKEKLGVETSDQMQNERIKDFFEGDTYELMESIYAPIYDQQGNFKVLLIGVCVNIGKNKEAGIVLFKMNPQDFKIFSLPSEGKYYVVDNKKREIVFVLGEEKVNSKKIVLSVIENKLDSSDMFFMQNNQRGLSFVLDVSDNTSQQSLIKFYHDIRILIVYILLVVLFVGFMAVWYNYKPIYTLFSLTSGSGDNEIDSIYFELSEQSELLLEQRMMIIDLIMNRLIYGIPISQIHIDKLGLSREISSYCAFLIKKYVLNSSETDYVMSVVEQEFSAELFVTDLQGEKDTVIVAFLKDNAKVGDIVECLKKWCADNIKGEYLFSEGELVTNLNDIQKSLKVCNLNGVQQMEASEYLKQNVLNYLEEHFRDQDLSQTKVADYFQVSVYSLSRLFKNQIAIGFTEYVTNKRFEYAREILATTDLPVKEVARMVGIEDANYFARIFKQYFGHSPSAFRKMASVSKDDV